MSANHDTPREAPLEPNWLRVKPENVPDELKALPCCVSNPVSVWNESDGDWRWTKPPSHPVTGRKIGTNRPEEWADFDTCAAAVLSGNWKLMGGLLPEESGIVGYDVDKIKRHGTLDRNPAVKSAIREYQKRGGYVERSPSGDGLRIFAKGDPVTDRKKRNDLEMYSDRRYLTITGHGGGALLDDTGLREAFMAAIGSGGESAREEKQGQDKAHAGPETAGAKVTDDLLAKIEAATRETLGEAAERFIPKETNEDGIELGGYAGRSEQALKVGIVIATKAMEAGLTDRATLEGVVHEVGNRLPVIQAWTDAGGSKWDRTKTVSNAVAFALAKWQGPKPSQPGPDGGEGQDWPEPEEISVKLPPVSPFDVEQHLPPCLADYVRDQAELMGTPPETIAAPLVVAMGAALGNRIGIRPKRHDSSWMTGGNLWGYTCASPGRMKSETVARGLAPLKALEKELSARHKVKRDQYEVDKVRYEVELAEFKKLVKSGAGSVVVPQPPEEPKPERLIAVDATVAKLGEICAASPHGVLIERDEITGLLAQLGAVGHEGDREFYLTGWNGGTNYKVDRIGRGSVEIPDLTLSMFGGIQPGKLNEYVRQATKGGAGADGLLARFQVAVYPDYDQTFRNVDRPPDLAAQERAFNAARHLFEIDPTAIGAKAIPGTERHYLQLTNEAQDLFDKWRPRLENALRKGDLHPALESHYAKYRSLIPKLALIFHLVEDGTGPVTIDALTMAIRWGNFLKAHARRIYAGALHGADLATKALSDKVKAGKVPNPFKVRDIYRAGWAGLSDKSDVEPAIDGLLEAGWIREEVIKGTGRTTTRYWVNPKIRPTGT